MNWTGAYGWLAGGLGTVVAASAALPVNQLPVLRPAPGATPETTAGAAAANGSARGGAEPAPSSKIATNVVDRLTLTSGEWVLGQCLGIAPDRGIVIWAHPLAAVPWELRSTGIREIQFGRRDELRTRPQEHAFVRLTNGDQLLGELEFIDSTQLVIRCTGVGRLRIPRGMVSEIVAASANEEVLYEGPNDLAEWSVRGDAQRQWEVHDGALIPLNPSPIGLVVRDAGDRLKIQFTMEWQGFPSYLNLWFFHDRPEGPSGDGYMMNIMAGQRVELMRISARGGARNLGTVELSGITRPRGQMTFTILADRKSGVVALCENRQLLKEWKDTTPFEGRGTAVSFMSQGGGMVKISNIRLARWNGLLPVAREMRKRDADTILLANGDVLSGRLEKLTNDVFVVQFAYGPAGHLELPAERVAQVALAEESATRARRRKGDVRVHFWDGGTVTVQLERADATAIVGTSENFGTATWPLHLVRRIEFDPYGDSSLPMTR